MQHFADSAALATLRTNRLPTKKSTTLTFIEMRCVRDFVYEDPTKYLDEYCEMIRRAFNKTISPSTMCRVLKRLGLTRKKLRIIAMQRCSELEIEYSAALRDMHSYQFIFLDETHADNRSRNRMWGYSGMGQRVCQRGF